MAKITINEIKDQKLWDKFTQKFSPNNFLASWQWADFNDSMMDETLRIGVYENSQLVGVCAAIKTISKKGNFLLSPAGPLFFNNKKNYWKILANYLSDIAKADGLKFIRIRPLIDDNQMNRKFLEILGFHPAPVKIPAEITWILNLQKREDELLSKMRKTTRYLVKKSEKEGVEVIKSKKVSDLEMYFKLEEATVRKHNFIPFSKKYVRTQFETFAKTNDALILLAKHKSKILSSAIITFFGNSAFYNYGASIETKIPASYAIQWSAICEAKSRGKKYYNFWGGIAPENQPNHPWSGITLFKIGFGGQKFETIHAYDLPISKLYKPIAIFESIRYKLRGHSL